MRILALAFVALAGTVGSAQAEWGPFKDLPMSESPITIALKGWENGEWRRNNLQREWPPISNSCTASNVYSNLQQGGYWGFLDFREASVSCDFNLGSVRTMIERSSTFKDSKVKFGKYDTVDNGSAEYRYLMFTSVRNDITNQCIGFTASWREFMGQGYLCSNKGLSEEAGRTFLKSVGYKNVLSPVAGALE